MIKNTIPVLIAALSIAACAAPKAVVKASSTIEEAPLTEGSAGPIAKQASPPVGSSTELVAFEAPEGFSVLMPKDPKVKRTQQQTPMGNLPTLQVVAEGSASQYSLIRIEFPPKMLSAIPEDSLLSGTVKGIAEQKKGTIVKETAAKIAGGKGEDFQIAEAKQMISGRVAMIGNSQYTLIVNHQGPLPAEATKFFESLSVPGSH